MKLVSCTARERALGVGRLGRFVGAAGLAAIGLLMAAPSVAQGQCGASCASGNCAVSNGDFESGTFADWTTGGNFEITGVYATTFDNMAVHGGTYASYWGAIGADATISQTIAANAGDQVVIDFWYAENGAGAADHFLCTFDGQTLIEFTNDNAHPAWTEMTFPVTVMNANPVLMFSAHNNPAYDYIDDISVCVTPGGPGACCVADGTCYASGPSNPCTGGFFAGVGSSCGPAGHCGVAIGACCNNTTGTCLYVPSVSCSAGSTYSGDGTLCSPNVCPAPGACCDDSAGTCSVNIATACSGTFQGPGTACAATTCNGACCNPASGACTVTGSAACASPGVFQSLGTTCTFNPCPQPPNGACCIAATQTCTSVSAFACGNLGGGYQGDNTGCGAGSCPFGACCLPCTGCIISTSTDCAGQSGAYGGDGSTCDTAGCSIINGGFESSTFAPGWTQFGDPSFTAVFTGDFDNFVAHGGGYFAYFGPTTGVGGIMQTIPAHAGDQVTIGFWYGVVAGETPNSFDCTFDGNSLVSFSNDVTNTTWTQFTFPVTVSADNPVLMFSFTNPPSYDFLDDVTVCIQSSTGSGVCCRGSTCNTSVAQAACTTSGGTAGAHFVPSVSACNSGVLSSGPCCYADYNKVNSITVQDIFDFLNDWFAGSIYAKVGGDGAVGGLSVQNIFDFLNDWFAGGCS